MRWSGACGDNDGAFESHQDCTVVPLVNLLLYVFEAIPCSFCLSKNALRRLLALTPKRYEHQHALAKPIKGFPGPEDKNTKQKLTWKALTGIRSLNLRRRIPRT